MKPSAWVYMLTLASAAPWASAESLYVIDQLVVGVSSAPDGTGDRVATLKSGDRVELLDRQTDAAQVQLANGTQGWVKGAYLSAEPPAQRRMLDKTAEVEKLKQDVSRLQAELSAARTSAPAQRAPPSPVSDPTASTPAPAAVRDASFFMTPPGQDAAPPWTWVLGSAALALIIGFIAGWRVLDRRIRRKYGGLRIY